MQSRACGCSVLIYFQLSQAGSLLTIYMLPSSHTPLILRSSAARYAYRRTWVRARLYRGRVGGGVVPYLAARQLPGHWTTPDLVSCQVDRLRDAHARLPHMTRHVNGYVVIDLGLLSHVIGLIIDSITSND